MFYWLTELSDKISFFNVFRYITFRTGGSIVTALVFVFLFGGPIIDLLRLKQGKGQPIRTDGPQSHLVTKKGTPTMGGLMILSGLLVSTLLWANPKNPYVWVVLGVTFAFGLIGFYDYLRRAGDWLVLAPVLGGFGLTLVTISHLLPIAIAYELVPDFRAAVDARTFDTRGHIYEALGRRDDAIADFRRALAIEPRMQGSREGLQRLGGKP